MALSSAWHVVETDGRRAGGGGGGAAPAASAAAPLPPLAPRLAAAAPSQSSQSLGIVPAVGRPAKALDRGGSQRTTHGLGGPHTTAEGSGIRVISTRNASVCYNTQRANGCRRAEPGGPTGGCRGLLRQRRRRLRGRGWPRAHRVSPRALAQVWHRLGDPCRQREPLRRGAVLLLQQLEERPQLQHPPGDSSRSRLPQDRATGHRLECLLVCRAGACWLLLVRTTSQPPSCYPPQSPPSARPELCR